MKIDNEMGSSVRETDHRRDSPRPYGKEGARYRDPDILSIIFRRDEKRELADFD
jgi:hypothetical protein